MAKGDHFFVWRQHLGVPFQHHVIDVGDGTVIHFTDGQGGVAGPGATTETFEVLRTSMETVTRDGKDKTHIVEHADKLEPDAIIRRAKSQIGKRGYHLLFDNCEHFASWCASGEESSRQVTTACERLTAAGFKTLAASTVRVASRLGANRLIKGANAGLLVAEAAQWATEAGGQHVGLRNPQQRRQAGRVVGGLTALGFGALGGPVGIALAGGIWVAGEMVGEASGRFYEQMREQHLSTDES